jgi:hypothetical protein
MSTDNLDSLSDAELSERVAVECAGYVKTDDPDHSTAHGSPQVWWDEKKKRCLISEPYSLNVYGHTRYNHSWKTAAFATDANAVLPLFEKTTGWACYDRDGWAVRLKQAEPALAQTLARSICIALLRAARAEKGAA